MMASVQPVLDSGFVRHPSLGWVYFVASQSAVKIGWSYDVQARLRQLQTSNPETLTLLIALPSKKEHEALFHQAFREFALSGEWFARSDDVNKALQAIVHSEDAIRLKACLFPFDLIRSKSLLDDPGPQTGTAKSVVELSCAAVDRERRLDRDVRDFYVQFEMERNLEWVGAAKALLEYFGFTVYQPHGRVQ